jgi:hypothetical protein
MCAKSILCIVFINSEVSLLIFLSYPPVFTGRGPLCLWAYCFPLMLMSALGFACKLKSQEHWFFFCGKCTWYKIYHLSHVSAQYSSIKYIYIVCSHYHHPSPKLSHLPKLKPCSHLTLTPCSYPYLLAAITIFSVFMNLTATRYLTWVESRGICTFVTGLFQLT